MIASKQQPMSCHSECDAQDQDQRLIRGSLETTVHIDNVSITTQVVGKPLYLTVAEAAAETRFSESFLRKLMRDGQLPHFKGDGNNGRVLIRTDELMAFMELRRVVGPTSPAI
jgi:excisionase family DNA binding protein